MFLLPGVIAHSKTNVPISIDSLKECGVKIRKSTDITTVMRSMRMLEEEKLIDVISTEDERDFIIQHTPTGIKVFAQYGSYLRFDKTQRIAQKDQRMMRIRTNVAIVSGVVSIISMTWAIFERIESKQKTSEIKSINLEIDSLRALVWITTPLVAVKQMFWEYS